MSFTSALSVLADGLYPDSERIGVNVLGSAAPYDLGSLNVRWFMAWTYKPSPPRPSGAEYYQTIRLRDDPEDDYWPPEWSRVEAAARANPGASWLIGNEPDHFGQDSCTPEEYAQRYVQCWRSIKAADPTAHVGAGGVAQATPLRIRYLDLMIDAMAAVTSTTPIELIDFWHIHEQILCETCPWGAGAPPGLEHLQDSIGCSYGSGDAANVDVYKGHIRGWLDTHGTCQQRGQQIEGMRQFMKRQGFQNAPLVISEYGVLQPSGCGYVGDTVEEGNAAVEEFMWDSFDFNLGVGAESGVDKALGMPDDGFRLVQRWAWYSANARMSEPDCSLLNSANGSLFSWQDPSVVTDFGMHFKAYTDRLRPKYVVALPWVVSPDGCCSGQDPWLENGDGAGTPVRIRIGAEPTPRQMRPIE